MQKALLFVEEVSKELKKPIQLGVYVHRTQAWYNEKCYWNIVIYNEHCTLETRQGIMDKYVKDFSVNWMKYINDIKIVKHKQLTQKYVESRFAK